MQWNVMQIGCVLHDTNVTFQRACVFTVHSPALFHSARRTASCNELATGGSRAKNEHVETKNLNVDYLDW